MSPVRMLKRIDPVDPFAIVLRAWDAAEPIVLQSARDADGATLAFNAERRRLKHNQVVGDLLLVRQGDDTRTLLWEPLRQQAGVARPIHR